MLTVTINKSTSLIRPQHLTEIVSLRVAKGPHWQWTQHGWRPDSVPSCAPHSLEWVKWFQALPEIIFSPHKVKYWSITGAFTENFVKWKIKPLRSNPVGSRVGSTLAPHSVCVFLPSLFPQWAQGRGSQHPCQQLSSWPLPAFLQWAPTEKSLSCITFLATSLGRGKLFLSAGL